MSIRTVIFAALVATLVMPSDAIGLSRVMAPYVEQAKTPRERAKTNEPKTVREYRQMFNDVPVTKWGGADIGLSVRLGDGRRVWLYGDTISINHGFVHSTALVQTGSKLHVSKNGNQLIPNAGDTFYWPETVTTQGKKNIIVTCAPITITGEGLFGFTRHPTNSRRARFTVQDDHDVDFVEWIDTVARPNIKGDGDDIEILGPNHYGYWKIVHDIKLRHGKFLRTMSQNWDDDFSDHLKPNGQLRYSDWRPLFSKHRGPPGFGY